MTYESCTWNSQQIHDFVTNLYPVLVASNVASTKIMLPEDQNWTLNLATNTMLDTTSSNMVGVLAAHGYGSTLAAMNNYGKPLWETEVATLNTTYDGSINEAMTWAASIHNYLTVAQANAWHFWWLVDLNTDNEGLTAADGTPAKRMYVLGQYSRFVRPNYYRIGVLNTNSVLVSAYTYSNSANFAIVAANLSSGSVTQTFTLSNFTAPSSVTPWLTSSNASLAPQSPVSLTGSSFTYTLPSLSVVTFVSQTNLPPVDITLLRNWVAENQPAGTTVASLLTSDPDPGNTFTYSLVSGAGSTNNASFSIAGSTLKTAASFNYAAQSVYYIRVRSTDQDGLWVEKAFTVNVTTTNLPPATPTNIFPASGAGSQPPTLALRASAFSDPNPGDSQAASEWLVQRQSDSLVVFDSGRDTTDKTNLVLGAGILGYGTTYSWQVRYQDSDGAWSSYSPATTFSTLAPSLTTSSQGANLVLSWPTNTTGFVPGIHHQPGLAWMDASLAVADALRRPMGRDQRHDKRCRFLSSS